MEIIHKIYGLTDPRNGELRYIGETIRSLQNRLVGHLADSRRKNNYCANWIKVLIRRNLRPEIFLLDEVNENDWQFWEQWHIAYWKSLGARLVNQTIGGDIGPIRTGSINSLSHKIKSGKAKRKTTEEQDKEIREKYWVWGFRSTKLAEIFKVSVPTICRIITGRLNTFDKKEALRIRRKLNDGDIHDIYEKYWVWNFTQDKLAEIYHVHRTTIGDIVSQKHYRDSLFRLGILQL